MTAAPSIPDTSAEARGETPPPVGGPRHCVSYLLASGAGLGRPCALASHTLLASSLPMAVMTLMSSSGHSSRSRDRTLDRWVPRFLWIPEHSMQIRAPRFRLAQSGSDAQHHTRSSDRCCFRRTDVSSLELTLSVAVRAAAVPSDTSDGLQSHGLRLAGQTRLKTQKTQVKHAENHLIVIPKTITVIHELHTHLWNSIGDLFRA